MPYTKSVASSVLAALELVGAPVRLNQIGDAHTRQDSELRILCIGFGGGSVPAFLVEMLPHCKVDVVELEPMVLNAAESMGFQPHPRIQLHLNDGANFANEAVSLIGSSLARGPCDVQGVDGNLVQLLL